MDRSAAQSHFTRCELDGPAYADKHAVAAAGGDGGTDESVKMLVQVWA